MKLAKRYKKDYYAAKVNKPGGLPLTQVAMLFFLMTMVSLGFADIADALIVFFGLSIFFIAFPYIFPEDTSPES